MAVFVYMQTAPLARRGLREGYVMQSGCCTNDATISVEEFRALMQETRRALGKQLEVFNLMRVRVGEKPLVLLEKRAA